tara:strand:- start:243 stop:584 length:342 start_codon:yes stop_codon:yes gene_type:complete
MEIKEKNLLLDQVKEVKYTIENGLSSDEISGEAFEYLEGVYDIIYYTDQSKNYLGSRILVAYGGPNTYDGPNIWIDTKFQRIEGYWGSDRETLYYDRDEMDLDGSLESFFENS